MQFSAAGEVAQRVDVGADMPAEGQSLGSRAGSGVRQIITVLFDQAEEKGGWEG